MQLSVKNEQKMLFSELYAMFIENIEKTGMVSNGVEAVINEDGSVIVNGTATKQASLGLDMKLFNQQEQIEIKEGKRKTSLKKVHGQAF